MMIGIAAWLLLKALPSLAGALGLPAGRAAIYAAAAAILGLALLSGVGRGLPRRC